jgi:hypothetical protein
MALSSCIIMLATARRITTFVISYGKLPVDTACKHDASRAKHDVISEVF